MDFDNSNLHESAILTILICMKVLQLVFHVSHVHDLNLRLAYSYWCEIGNFNWGGGLFYYTFIFLIFISCLMLSNDGCSGSIGSITCLCTMKMYLSSYSISL